MRTARSPAAAPSRILRRGTAGSVSHRPDGRPLSPVVPVY
jgi:hypothetical protein